MRGSRFSGFACFLSAPFGIILGFAFMAGLWQTLKGDFRSQASPVFFPTFFGNIQGFAFMVDPWQTIKGDFRSPPYTNPDLKQL